MSYKVWIVLLVSVVLGIFFADILTFKNPVFGVAGFYVWVFAWILILGLAIRSVVSIFRFIRDNQTYFTFVMIMILVLIVVVHAFNINNGSLESTQQIGCTLDQLTTKVSKGFRDYCFIGYPTRQYYVPAIPTLLFGKSYGVINMGYSIYLLTGFAIFTAGLLAFLKKRYGVDRADIAVSFGLASFLHLFFFSHILLMYEQSIFPLAIGLSGVGLMLEYFSSRKVDYLLGASIILFNLIFAYTPALALYAFGIGLFGFLIVRKSTPGKHRVIMLSVIGMSLISMFLSLKMRTDIQLVGGESGSKVAIQDVLNFARDFVLHQDVIFSTWTFHIIFLVAIVASVASLYKLRSNWKKGWIPCMIMLWVIAAICFGTFSKGYATPPPSFGIHRGLVTIPVLIPLILYLAIPLIKRIPIKVLYLLLVIFFAHGLFYHSQYVKDKDEFANRFVNFKEFARYSRYIKFLSYTVKKNDQLFKLYFDPETSLNFQAIDTARKYYYPQSEFILLKDGCDIVDTYSTSLYVAYQDPVCKNMKFRYLGTFIFDNEKPMRMYQIAKK